MRKILIFVLLTIHQTIIPDNIQKNSSDKDLELLQEALEIVASMSDNVANLVIQHKTKTNSPELTKQEAVALVEKITDLVVVIIKKARKKKSSRGITLYSQEEFDAIINHIADEILLRY